MVELTQEQVKALEGQKPKPLELVNPATQEVFVLIRKNAYDEELVSQRSVRDVRESYPLLDEVAGKAGWDDPAMDVYTCLLPGTCHERVARR